MKGNALLRLASIGVPHEKGVKRQNVPLDHPIVSRTRNRRILAFSRDEPFLLVIRTQLGQYAVIF